MNKKLEVIQEECSDCGICSLASIIKYYGGNISLETLRFYTATNSNGTNAYELINCAKRFGFDAYGEKCKDLSKIKTPFIAHLKLENDFYHFVVIYKVENNIVTIMDPSIGFKKMNIKDFYKIYTGVILNFIPIGTIPKYKENKFFKNMLKKEIIINRFSYITILILSLFIMLFSIINNFEIKILSLNNEYIYILFFIIFVNEILIYLKNLTLLNSSIIFNNKLIKEFINHLFKLPLYYLKLKQKGEIVSRFNELNDLSNSIINFCIEIIFCFILSLISIICLFIFSFKITLIIILLTIIYIIFNIKIYRTLVNEIRYSINLEESYNSNILDYISNFDTIKHLNIYDFFINNINISLIKRNVVSKKYKKRIYLISLINNIIFGIIILIVIYFLLTNSFNVTNSLVIYSLLNFYINNLKYIVESYPNILILKTYIKKTNEFLSFNLDKNGIMLYKFSNISIEKLLYKINGKIIINNMSYKIYNKDKIFINGPSGIGKSTLMKILNNEINRYSGNILIDGLDINKCNLDNLVTYVSQDEKLFNDTIYNNLCLGKDVDKSLLENILRITRLNDINIIKLVGLNSTIINDNSLSGGEKNRLILARSLIHSNDILILDEVLKEVDEKLEKEILKDILDYFDNKTILYISHKSVSDLFEKVLTFRKE